jgi:hypothetical protein
MSKPRITNRPHITTTAAAQFVYDDPRAAITRPDQFASLSHYFIANWLPGITPNGLKILIRLRSLGYYQPKTGMQRGTIDIDQALLATQCGMGLRTLQRIFSDDPIFAKYVQREFHVERDRQQRIIREHYIYVVKMDDVLTQEDEIKLQRGSEEKNAGEDRQEPTRQNDVSEVSPIRQNGTSECQNGGPECQNDMPTRQNGASYKESLTLLTEEDTLDTPAGGPEISLTLFEENQDVLDSLSPDQWATLEAEARAQAITETTGPIRDLVKAGKAWAVVKPLMRKLLIEIR